MKKETTKKKVSKKKEKTFIDRVSEVYKKEVKLYQDANIQKVPYIHFPGNKVPFLSKMAIKLLQRQGGKFETKFVDLLKDKK